MSKKNTINNEEEVVLTGQEKEIASDIAKCPSCGANLTFFPDKQLLKCDHCSTEVPFEIFKSEEKKFERLFEDTSRWSDETHVYSCSNCGAKQVLSKTEIGTNCSFCGASNIVETSELSGLKPNAIVPFSITKENAVTRVIEWVRKKLFAPKSFKKSVTAEEVSGVYNPAFTFDTQTTSYYSGRLGKYYYVTKKVNGKTVSERRVKYFNIHGTFGMMFDDVLVQASTVIKQKTIDKLQPFATNSSKEYAKEFLHGYSASQYTKDGKQCWQEAKKQIDNRIRRGILGKYSYDFVEYLTINTSYNKQTYKYLLLPLYVGHFRWKLKAYNFFINGYNGRITGKTPVSGLKVMLAALIGIAFAALIGTITYFMLR